MIRVNVPLILAGSLAILGAGIHGLAGELLVVRKLSPAMLPPSRFGGPSTTRRMIHVTWHMTTIAFLTVGCALLAAGSALHGDTRRALALLAAGAATGFAALAIGMGASAPGFPRALARHPAPTMLTATAALAWIGAL
jgi:hypothetical protein